MYYSALAFRTHSHETEPCASCREPVWSFRGWLLHSLLNEAGHNFSQFSVGWLELNFDSSLLSRLRKRETAVRSLPWWSSELTGRGNITHEHWPSSCAHERCSLLGFAFQERKGSMLSLPGLLLADRWPPILDTAGHCDARQRRWKPTDRGSLWECKRHSLWCWSFAQIPHILHHHRGNSTCWVHLPGESREEKSQRTGYTSAI